METFASVNGILIHQLPRCFELDTMKLFQSESILNTAHNEIGLRIYFKHYDPVYCSVSKKNLIVKGTVYAIYPLVTNLTIHGIGPNANKSMIRKLFKHYGTIINSYPVQIKKTQALYETVSLSDDYRIILDVPEVFANFQLAPVSLPETDCEYQVTFFCRLCRQDGHKQHQCLKPWETLGASTLESEYCLRRGILKFSDQYESSDYQRYADDYYYNSYDFTDFKSSDTSKITGLQQLNEQKYKKTETNRGSCHQNIPLIGNAFHSFRRLLNASGSAEVSGPSDYLNNFGSDYDINSCSNTLPESKEASNTSGYLQLRKSEPSFRRQLSTSSKHSGGCESSDCPTNINSDNGHKINLFNETLNYMSPQTHKQMEKQLEARSNNCDRNIPNPHFLPKEQLDSEEDAESFRTERHRKDDTCTEECQQESNIVEEERVTKKTISSGIVEAVYETTGVLEPQLLITFLNRVRGRRNLLALVKHFTQDLTGLADQLNNIIRFYYRSDKKGIEEDRDVQWMESLRKRLYAAHRNRRV